MWWQRILHHVEELGVIAASGETDEATLHLPVQAVRQLNRLHLTAGRYLPGSAAGLRPSMRRRPSFDFHEHRLYTPGDDVRFVDWKASARQEHIFVRQGEHPKEATVNLLLDGSASMKWGTPPKSIIALQLTIALGFAALAHHDRLVVQPMTRRWQPAFGPVTGKGQVPALINYLRPLRFEGDIDLTVAVQALTRRAKGGLVFILSDLLGVADPAAALALLPRPSWDVIVLHLLHPEELHPDLEGDFQMIDIETGEAANYDINKEALDLYQKRLTAWRISIEDACSKADAFYTLIPTNWTLASNIIPHLRAVHVLSPI
jgi:uncharacterized protein (DUF58 family)